MSFTLDLIVGELPSDSTKAWAAIERLRGSYYDDKRPRAPALVSLHAELIKRYPCLASYADGDDSVDDCPWADGPMIDNFAHEMGMLAISFSRADEVVPFVVEKANQLGITVADGQSGVIHRPGGPVKPAIADKPWWRSLRLRRTE